MRVVTFLYLLLWLPISIAREAIATEMQSSDIRVPVTPWVDHMKRAVTLDICANIGIVIPGATVPIVGTKLPGITLATVCLCLDNGQLTGPSNTLLSGLITPAVTTLLNTLGVSLSALAIAQLGAKTTTCVYPANSVPNSCTDCSFGCDAGFKKCNDACIANVAICPTGGGATGSRRKRHAQKLREDLRCPRGFDACRVPHGGGSLRLDRKAYDCVNSRTDLESCGGCIFPGPGQILGMDCTELPASAAVSCVNAKCVIDSCLRGFALFNGTCVPQVASRRRRRTQVQLGLSKTEQPKIETLSGKAGVAERALH